MHYVAPTNITLTVQKELHVKDEVLKGFMDNITRNLKYLGEGQYPKYFFLPNSAFRIQDHLPWVLRFTDQVAFLHLIFSLSIVLV